MGSTAGKRLNINNINPHVKAAKYAVRGELAVKSEEYRAYLQGGLTDLPFSKVISANIGNPQQLDQKPITFFRQVLSLLENPALLNHEDVLLNQLGYKSDVAERAKWLLQHVGSVGAYSASNGVPAIRQSIADFLESGLPFSLRFWFCSDAYIFQGAMASQPSNRIFTYPPVHPLVSIPYFTLSAPTRSLVSWFRFPNILSTQPLSQF